MKRLLIVLLMFTILLPCFAAKAKKQKKNKKTSKTQSELTQKLLPEDGDFLINDDVIFDDTEIITREQIDSMFSLASQLNADIQAAIEKGGDEELDSFIADEKAQLDKILPSLKHSSEWTAEDEERFKVINSEYKMLSRKYKPKK